MPAGDDDARVGAAQLETAAAAGHHGPGAVGVGGAEFGVGELEIGGHARVARDHHVEHFKLELDAESGRGG